MMSDRETAQKISAAWGRDDELEFEHYLKQVRMGHSLCDPNRRRRSDQSYLSDGSLERDSLERMLWISNRANPLIFSESPNTL